MQPDLYVSLKEVDLSQTINEGSEPESRIPHRTTFIKRSRKPVQSLKTSYPKINENTMELFDCHPRHRLKFSDSKQNSHCNMCSKSCDGGVWCCRECNFNLCRSCSVSTRIIPEKETFDIYLNITGGCWNLDLLTYDETKFSINVNKPCSICSFNLNKSAWEDIAEVSTLNQEGKEIKGAITNPIKFHLYEVKIDDLSDLVITISLNSTFVVRIPFNEEISAELSGKETFKRLNRFWKNIPFESSIDLSQIFFDDQRESSLSCKVPQLYSKEKELGFLNVEMKVDGYKPIEKKSVFRNRTTIGERKPPSQESGGSVITTPTKDVTYMDNEDNELQSKFEEDQKVEPRIDDINIVKMIVRNRRQWDEFSRYLTPEVFNKAFLVYLSRNWRDLFNVCAQALKTAKKNILTHKPGNWVPVEKDCEEIVSKLLNEIPTDDIEDQSKSGILEFKELQKSASETLPVVFKYELKTFAGNDSFFELTNSIWNKPQFGLWPITYDVSASFIFKVTFINFFLFLLILTYHHFGFDRTNEVLFERALGDTIGLENFQACSDFSTYWIWLNETFLPALFKNEDEHLLMLIDDVLLRQIRVDSGKCTNPLNEIVPGIDKIPECYPRIYDTSTWHPKNEVWQNMTFMAIGKDNLKASTFNGYYGPEGYARRLSKNVTDIKELLLGLNETIFLDWETQAVIIEYAVYSPNVHLFSACVTIAEFSNTGVFEPSHECQSISPRELRWSRAWSSIVLYIFFAGYIIQEIWEFIRGVVGIKRSSVLEKAKMRHFFRICFPVRHGDVLKDDDDENTEDDSCCANVFYELALHVNDVWNLLDLSMIAFGLTGLILHEYALRTLEVFTLDELWLIASIEDIAKLFDSICVVVVYLRILNYFVPFEYIGVLVLTVFKMFEAVFRFIIVFAFVSLGFSTAFHIVYDNSVDYSTWTTSVLQTVIPTFSGYQVPTYLNYLAFVGPRVAYALQAVYVIIGVVLLLNFLIALMNSVYETFRDNATQEYRWFITTQLNQLNLTPWPVPLILLQVLFVPLLLFFQCCCTEVADQWLGWGRGGDVESETEKGTDAKHLIFATMVGDYFKETLPEEEYIKNTLFDHFNVNDKVVQEERKSIK